MSVKVHGNIAVLTKGAGATVQMLGVKTVAESAAASRGAFSMPKSFTSLPYEPWGADNLFPQNVIKDARLVPMLRSGLGFKARVDYANGPVAFIREINADGKEIIKPVDDPDFKQFMRNPVNRAYFKQGHLSVRYFLNLFPNLIYNMAGTKIVQCQCLKPAYSRWGKINPTKGYIDKLFYSANWEWNPNSWDDEIPVLDNMDPIGDLKSRTDSYNYIYPVQFPALDTSYYTEADWESARASGWVKIAQTVPKFKQAIFDNSLGATWHIKIPFEYWPMMYQGYDTKSEEEKLAIRQQELEELDDMLFGVENQGKSFVSHFFTNHQGKAVEGWSIEPIDNKLKDGQYIPDGNQANQEIAFAIGLDSSLPGAQLSGDGKMGARTGGSDKREAWMINTALARFERDFVYEPLYAIRDINGWNPDLEFGARDIVLTPLDANPTGQNKSLN